MKKKMARTKTNNDTVEYRSVHGTKEVKLQLAARRLREDMFVWFDRANVPCDRRLSDLTLLMFGDIKMASFECPENPGSNLKTKAAETGASGLTPFQNKKQYKP